MMNKRKSFGGKVLFLDRADINTDEIIAAKYLTEITKTALGPHLFEDIKLDDFDINRDLPGKTVVISRANFGCGYFARIFRQNMFNCGMLAIELPAPTIDHIFKTYADLETTVTINLEKQSLTIDAGDKPEEFQFSLSDFDRALVEAGGWVEYADRKY